MGFGSTFVCEHEISLSLRLQPLYILVQTVSHPIKKGGEHLELGNLVSTSYLSCVQAKSL